MTKIKTRKTNKTRQTKKIRQTRKTIKTRRSSHKKNRSLRGGTETEKKDKIIMDNFRYMFMNSFTKLQSAIKSNNMIKIKDAIENFKKGFKSNQIGINTLIPITNDTIPIDKYKKPSETPLITFVPLLVVIFNNIYDSDTRKALTNAFLKNNGNINLQSYDKKISVLSEAIQLQDKDLVNFLLEKNPDITILTGDQKVAMDNLLKETIPTKQNVKLDIIPTELPTEIPTDLPPDLPTELPPKQLIKLDIPTELPTETDYNPEVEPEFWKPIFEENEMITLRKQINDMMIADGNISITNKEVSKLWSLCKINQSIIPTYFTPTKNEPYDVFGTQFQDRDVDFAHFNIILCAALLIFGIISYKMIGQDYKIIFKGGKAIQLVLAEIPELGSSYKSEDIDVLILPDTNILYNEANVKNLSGQLAYLIRWFLNIPAIENKQETQYKISVQSPNPENTRANPFIFKLSYVKVFQKQDFRKNIMIDDFKPFSDIDFKDPQSNIKASFEDSKEYKFYISELNQNIIFRCPNLGSILDEKIYYYAKYSELKKLLQEKKPITEEGYQQITIYDCERFLEKFKRAILAMNKGLQKQRKQKYDDAELLEREKNSINTRLTKLGITDELLKQIIVQSLYK